MSRELCRDVPDPCGSTKSLYKKVRAHFSFPTSERQEHYAAPIGVFFCPEIRAFTGDFFNRFQSS